MCLLRYASKRHTYFHLNVSDRCDYVDDHGYGNYHANFHDCGQIYVQFMMIINSGINQSEYLCLSVFFLLTSLLVDYCQITH